MKKLVLSGLVCAALAACHGKLGLDPDAGAATDAGTDVDALVEDLGPALDATRPPDMAEPMVDPLCVGVTCTPSSSCYGGQCYCDPGFMGDPAVGCTAGNPCEGVSCAFGATCHDDGMCACDPGFASDDLGGCVFEMPSFPDERTQMEVCQRWTADYPTTAVMPWQIEPADTCDGGILDPQYQLDAVRRVSLFRWLAGLPAVTSGLAFQSIEDDGPNERPASPRPGGPVPLTRIR